MNEYTLYDFAWKQGYILSPEQRQILIDKAKNMKAQNSAMQALLERCLKVLPVTMEDNHWWCSGCCTWVSCEGVTNVEECAICGTDLSCCQPNSKIYNLRDNIKTLLKEAKE